MNKIVIEWNEGMGKIKKRLTEDEIQFFKAIGKPEDMSAEPQIELDQNGNE